MNNLNTFLTGLLLISTFTGLVTEAIKKILAEHNKRYHANTLAGVVSLILSAGLGLGYILLSELTFTPQVIVSFIALVSMSWLCAMIGYDKVVQTINQFNKTGKDDFDE